MCELVASLTCGAHPAHRGQGLGTELNDPALYEDKQKYIYKVHILKHRGCGGVN